ncbi:CvpA family protein [Bacillus sp. CGMCC 1.16607]|uniref:CvpA family protein n=1 Tax=Bacillus sp. CGMCC 1.16607 TaxID=3351842 RepID=UPI00363A5BA4
MLDIAILFILLIGFFVGLKRGFILQLIHLTGFIVAFIVASMYYDDLAPKLTLWVPYPNLGNENPLQFIFDGNNIEEAYYRAIAYAAIFFAVKILLQIIGTMLDFIAHIPILKQLNVWAGGILGVIEVYLLLLILLYIAALLPLDFIQAPLKDSSIAKAIINHTPILSKQIKEMWFDYIAAKG